MFDSLLVANRGEIARRIIRTARRLGLRTIAVYSDVDRGAPFVAEAHEALGIGPAAAKDSYLDVDRIIDAARRSGAKAIHPGYGFLSERSELASACERTGIVFVGPPASIIAQMGSKIAAKKLAQAIGVQTIPGFEEDEGGFDRLRREAKRIGFPLLVKASAGGGGKGIRPVADPSELEQAVDGARREAARSFGDDRLILERKLSGARHVEVQIAADNHGSLVHLFDRDCSVQRNNQKILEEAPPPGLAEELRSNLHSDAVRLARQIDYRNLGTVEFLVDAATGGHFFLEMNTRLQVEHPVTEMITGLDLVELQLRIAAGEPLGFSQDELTVRGHAIEARLAAERPDDGFNPSSGRVHTWISPSTGPELRVDSGIERGSRVSLHYDSMLAKIIAHGPNREDARRRLINALDELTLLGVATNRTFLRDLLSSIPFASGALSTDLLDRAFPGGWAGSEPSRKRLAGIASALFVLERLQRHSGGSPWHRLKGFRLLTGAGQKNLVRCVVTDDTGDMLTEVTLEPDGVRAQADGQPIHIAPGPEPETFRLIGLDQAGRVTFEGSTIYFRLGEMEAGLVVRAEVDVPRTRVRFQPGSDVLVAPMPGIIAEVLVRPGDLVEEGDGLIFLESMKLIQVLGSPRRGTVGEIAATAGTTVASGDELVRLAPE